MTFIFVQRRSKSDWSLSDTSQQEAEGLLQKLKSEPVGESQYFDALGPIDEEGSGSSSSSQWEEFEEDEDQTVEPKEKKRKRRSYSSRNKVLNERLKRRIGALKNLQLESKTLESQFYVDLLSVESRYWSEFREPLHRKRQSVITEDGSGDGVPDFWVRAMKNCEMLKDIIQKHDLPVLGHLKDIKIISPFG